MEDGNKLHMIPVATVLLLMVVCVTAQAAPTPVTGKTIRVGAGGDFQAALAGADPGGEIVLDAGARYTGNFVLPITRAVIID